jgi:hypothetical protein
VAASGGAFVDDKQFGRVLSLSWDDGVFLSLPAATLAEVESLSVVGWVNLAADKANQRLFDFGKNADASFYCDLTGAEVKDGYRAQIASSSAANEPAPAAAQIATDRWVHLAVVLDPANKTLTIYTDGARVGQTKNIAMGIDQVLDQQNADLNKLYIGRSQSGGNGLKAKLHDVRLYSEALNDEQVATIRRNAIAGTQRATNGADGKADNTSRMQAANMPNSAGPELSGVTDITATTNVGQLPKLPITIAAMYASGAKGPEVRVIWPSPRDNNVVLKAGITVTAKLPARASRPRQRSLSRPKQLSAQRRAERLSHLTWARWF